jgi:CoA:oxalate CoA-transferase
MVVKVDGGNDKEIKIVGNPIKMSEIKQERFKFSPKLGEDTEDILSRMLGYSPAEIKTLKEQKVI